MSKRLECDQHKPEWFSGARQVSGASLPVISLRKRRDTDERWFNSGPASQTPAQNWTSVASNTRPDPDPVMLDSIGCGSWLASILKAPPSPPAPEWRLFKPGVLGLPTIRSHYKRLSGWHGKSMPDVLANEVFISALTWQWRQQTLPAMAVCVVHTECRVVRAARAT